MGGRCSRIATKICLTLMVCPIIFGTILHAQQAAEPAGEPQRPPPLPHPDLPDIPAVPEATPWVMLISAGLLIAALAGLIIWLLFSLPKLPPTPPAPEARRKALGRLKTLRSEAETLPPPEVSSHVSQILRTYLYDRFGLPGPTRTTQEIFEAGSKASTAVSPEFVSVVQWCDEISFMPKPTTVEQSLSLIDAAINRLEQDR